MDYRITHAERGDAEAVIGFLEELHNERLDWAGKAGLDYRDR